MNKNNPVEKEFKKLGSQWQRFLDSDLPIFHWMVPSDSVQLLNAFIKIKEQFDEKTPEMFVHLTVPFSGLEQFATDLADEFNQLVKEGLDDTLPEGGEDCPWQAPDTRQSQSGFQALLKSCDAFLQTFGDCLDALVLVIAPPSVPEGKAYLQWWQWACTIHRDYDEWPDKLKWITLDHIEQPYLHAVVAEFPEQIYSEIADCDYKGALTKVLDDADDGSDAAKIRKNLFNMNNAIAESDGNALKQSRDIALPLARSNNWFDIAATINMTCAAGLMSWQHYDTAINEYQKAQEQARLGMQADLPGSEKLLLQSMLNESTCLYLNDNLAPAAKAFEKTAGLAHELGDPWIELEAWRMGSFCLERAGQQQQAWVHGKQALAVGRTMEVEQRLQSTLPFVGQALMRMSPDTAVANEVDGVMIDLIGENWQQTLKEASS